MIDEIKLNRCADLCGSESAGLAIKKPKTKWSGYCDCWCHTTCRETTRLPDREQVVHCQREPDHRGLHQHHVNITHSITWWDDQLVEIDLDSVPPDPDPEFVAEHADQYQ